MELLLKFDSGSREPLSDFFSGSMGLIFDSGSRGRYSGSRGLLSTFVESSAYYTKVEYTKVEYTKVEYTKVEYTKVEYTKVEYRVGLYCAVYI